MMWRLLWCVVCAAAGAGELAPSAGAGCGLAEFPCRNLRCVRQDQYCDGEDHCGDSSDEPPRCTVCNRTYYGRVGVTYSLALEASARAPLLCHVTLTAGGGARGELVQLLLDDFRVGRLLPRPACADGEAQLAELGRPFAGGAWCGRAAGAVYFSEAATVTLTVRARRGPPPALRLRYRFLPRAAALARLPEPAPAAPGRCALALEDCHRRPCRLRSPNFPGLYPRNASCYWSVRQRAVPACKHAMIAVRQAAAHKLRLRSVPASVNRTRGVAAWAACGAARDRLLFYDGASTDDALLALVCGGDALPAVVSRGPAMLVAFHSAPYAAPRAAAPLSPLTGFELDVDVIFADSDSLDYAREPHRCEFHVKASSSSEEAEGGEPAGRGRRGEVRAPTHSLPPDTACTWTFHGRPGDLVWIYFSSYVHYSLEEPPRGEDEEEETEEQTSERPGGRLPGERAPLSREVEPPAPTPPASPWARLREMMRPRPAPPAAPSPEHAQNGSVACPTELRIWDGGGPDEPDSVLLGRWCRAPAVCARAALLPAPRSPRACAPPDGYVSSRPLLSLAVRSARGTATHPLRFSLHYEFVDTQQAGEPLEDVPEGARPDCSRLVTTPGLVPSPRDVRLFGRGGARRLRCVTRLSAGEGGRVSLSLLSLSLGAGPRPPPAAPPVPLCVTRTHPHTGLPSCESPTARAAEARGPGDPLEEDWDAVMSSAEVADPELDEDSLPRVLQLRVWDVPWPGVRVLRACYCGDETEEAATAAPGPLLRLESWGAGLELELVASRLRAREDQRHVRYLTSWERAPPAAAPLAPPPPGSRLRLEAAPVLLRARPGRSVFLRVWGEAREDCPRTAVLVYAVAPPRLLAAVCPRESERAAVHVFSESWSAEWRAGGSADRSLLVVGAGARASWMEVWRPLRTDNASAGCAHGCPELRACAGAALWCDGAEDCPRGEDERCGGARRLWARVGGARGAGGAGALAAAGAALVAWLAWRRRRSREEKGARRLTDEALFGSRSSCSS